MIDEERRGNGFEWRRYGKSSYLWNNSSLVGEKKGERKRERDKSDESKKKGKWEKKTNKPGFAPAFVTTRGEKGNERKNMLNNGEGLASGFHQTPFSVLHS